MNTHIQERKKAMKRLVDKMANPRQELHELYKDKMKQMILIFLEHADSSDETSFSLDSFNGNEKEFISEWVENSFVPVG